MMVVDDEKEGEIEIANQDRGNLQRFDFDSTFTSSSFTTSPQPKLTCSKKNCKSTSLIIIIIVVAYLQTLYDISISLSYGKETIDSANKLYDEYLPW
jgi:hypothetical protein